MATRRELEAALKQAEASWRDACLANETAEAQSASAYAAWEGLVVNQRKARTDRRKIHLAWDEAFADRRDAHADRRNSRSDIAAFASMVARQHEAYLAQRRANARSASTKARVKAAAAERDRLVAALAELERPALGVAAPRPVAQAIVTALKKPLQR